MVSFSHMNPLKEVSIGYNGDISQQYHPPNSIYGILLACGYFHGTQYFVPTR